MRKSFTLCLLMAILHGVVARGQQIHVLLVADTADDKLRDACTATVANITNALRRLIPADHYSLTVMESRGEQYTHNPCWRQSGRHQLQKTILLCFCTMVMARVLVATISCKCLMAGGSGDAQVQEAMVNKPCRLKVILTDSCNVPLDRGAAPPCPAPPAAKEWDAEHNGIAPVIEELFINHSGLMHMNGAWPGQFGFGNSTDGSWLFLEFFDYCRSCPTGRPTWGCMDRMMDRRLGERFQQVFDGKFVEPSTGYTQTSLKTISWSFPKTENHETHFPHIWIVISWNFQPGSQAGHGGWRDGGWVEQSWQPRSSPATNHRRDSGGGNVQLTPPPTAKNTYETGH